MALTLEVNVIHFPNAEPSICIKEKDQKWTDEKKKGSYLSESRVHLIKLGPLSEEFLTRKKIGWSKVDFGVDFQITEDGKDYKWTSGSGAEFKNGIEFCQVFKLRDALAKIGYVEGEYQRFERKTGFPVEKIIFTLHKQF